MLLAAASVHADTLASYPFTGSSLASTDTSATSTATAITLGTGLTDATDFTASFGNPSPALRINGDETAATLAGSVTAGDDFVFSITPDSGDVLELQTLTFDLALDSTSFASNVAVQLSVTGSGYVTAGSITAFSSTSFAPESVSLAGANTALAAGLPIYVRFVVYDNTGAAAAYTAFDNITVNGTSMPLAVPEPGTYALLALGMVGAASVIMLRRRAIA